jgi:hypothetical protein
LGHRSREGAVAAEKLRHVGFGRRQGIEMVSMRQQITPLCFAS